MTQQSVAIQTVVEKYSGRISHFFVFFINDTTLSHLYEALENYYFDDILFCGDANEAVASLASNSVWDLYLSLSKKASPKIIQAMD